MTHEELEQACRKFSDYLTANGERVVAFGLQTDRSGVIYGNTEMTNELAVQMLAHHLGLKVGPR